MIGRLKDLTMNMDGSQNITVAVHADFRETFDDLADKDVEIEIKKYSAKRSLDASARAWVLIDQIAEKLGIKKHEVYRNAIREIGGVSDIVCVRDEAVESLCNGWQEHGIGWQTETSKSKIPGCTNVTLYYGSSMYTVHQMAMLIDSLVQDANELGITTMTPDEQKRLIEQWGKKLEKKEEKRKKEKQNAL